MVEKRANQDTHFSFRSPHGSESIARPWYEMIWKVDDQIIMGITMPGIPVMVFGRFNYFAWGGTYGFMDMIDYFIEDCKDEKFLYDNKWLPFEKRIETIRPKKKEPITLTFNENHHGILEGDPKQAGKYLSMAFSGRSGSGADIFNIMMRLHEIHSVKAAQIRFRELSRPTFNWVFVDRNGNIGYQLNGKMAKQRKGMNGLLPLPGMESKNDWQGFVDPAKFPSSYNPAPGFFATANTDMNEYGDKNPINLSMAPYRLQRIIELLEANHSIDTEYIKQMHGDLYSKQAERLMPLIMPLLPDTENGRILKNWEFKYREESTGAMLYESVYLTIIKTVFGKNGVGEEVMEHLFNHTGLFTDFYGNFDDVLMAENSPWFDEVDRTTQLKEAIEHGLNIQAKPYVDTQKIDLLNIFIGGKFPKFLGFDVKNITIPGNRATIPKGQIFTLGGRKTTFAPSFRMIVEIEKAGMWTNIASGPSGNRFSKWYKSDLKNWREGRYKKLEIIG